MIEGERRDIEALLHGEDEAFCALFGSLHPVMVGLARAVVGRTDWAEEVAQETWIAVLRGLPGYGFRSRLETWILGILVKRAKTFVVRERRALGAETSPPLEQPVFRATPQDHLLDKETRAWLFRAVARLPEQQRLTFTLREIHELGPAEVTARLGVSPGCQRVRLHRARKRLRGMLAAPAGIERHRPPAQPEPR